MEKVITIWHSYATKSGFLATGPIYLTHIFFLNSLDLDKARLLSSLINLQTVWLSPSDTRVEQNQVFLVTRHIFNTLDQGQATHSAESDQGPNCLKRQ